MRETFYDFTELTTGICSCCGEASHEILKGDGRCVDCIEEDLFIRESFSQHEDMEYTDY